MILLWKGRLKLAALCSSGAGSLLVFVLANEDWVSYEDLSSKDQREGWITAGSGRGGSRAEISLCWGWVWALIILLLCLEQPLCWGGGRHNSFVGLCRWDSWVGCGPNLGAEGGQGDFSALQFSLPVASARSSISILVYCREEFQLFISIFLPIFAVSFLISFLILNDLLTSNNQQIISGTARVHLGCSVNDISTAALTFPSDKEWICAFHHFCSSSCRTLGKKHVLIFPPSEDKTAWVQKVEAFPGLGALCSELCGQQDAAADGCWLKPV